MIKKEEIKLSDRIVSVMLDESQEESVNKLCKKHNKTFSDIVRIALKNVAINFKEENTLPSSYRNVKKGVRLSENDAKILTYIMRKYNINNISECIRLCLIILMRYTS